MKITKLEPVTKQKFKVYIDGRFAFVLYKGELSRFSLRENVQITEQTKEKIRTEVILKRAKLRALHLLEAADRTEAALREKLRQGFFPPDIAEEAVAYVKSFGYLSDARYAESFVRGKMETKSRAQIRALLTARGVEKGIIETALETCYEQTESRGEEEAILKILRKKCFDPDCQDPVQIQKIYASLARKGFRYDTVRQVIQNYHHDA